MVAAAHMPVLGATAAAAAGATTPRRKHRKRTVDGIDASNGSEANWAGTMPLRPGAPSSHMDMAMQWSQQHDVPDLSQALQAASALGLLQQQQQQRAAGSMGASAAAAAAATTTTSGFGSPKRVQLARDRQ